MLDFGLARAFSTDAPALESSQFANNDNPRDDGSRDPGNCCLHESRASPWASGRQAIGYLVVRNATSAAAESTIAAAAGIIHLADFVATGAEGVSNNSRAPLMSPAPSYGGAIDPLTLPPNTFSFLMVPHNKAPGTPNRHNLRRPVCGRVFHRTTFSLLLHTKPLAQAGRSPGPPFFMDLRLPPKSWIEEE